MMRIVVGLLLSVVASVSWGMSALEAWEARKKPGVSFEQWQKENKVRIKSWLKEEKDLAIGEQAILYIDISTDNWFTAGTYFGAIEAIGAIAKRRKSNSNNYVEQERRDGEFISRAHQLFEVVIYPTSTGEVIIPSIPITVTVSTAPGKEAKGTLFTEPMRLRARLPDAALTEGTRWVSSSDLTVEQVSETVQKDEEVLTVGDAVKRVITTRAADTLSILLPPTEATLPEASTRIVKAYPADAELMDYQERGFYGAKRIETTTYILKSGGTLILPEQKIIWWDTENEEVKTEVLPAITLQVRHTPLSFVKTYWFEIALIMGISGLLIALVVTLQQLYKRNRLPQGVYYQLDLRRGRWGKVRLHLYTRLQRLTGSRTLRSYSDDQAWQQEVTQWQEADGTPSNVTANALWSRMSRQQAKRAFSLPKALPELERFKQ